MKRSLDTRDGLLGVGLDGAVRLRPPCTVEVGHGDSRVQCEFPGLGRSNWVEAWVGKDWLCLVGLEGPEVVVVRSSPAPTVAVAGELDRLDLSESYDPGGLHRVSFYPLQDPDSLLIEYEFGVARLDASACRLVWHRVHGDLTCRIERVDQEFAWLAGEYDRFGYRLSDGLFEA